MRLPKLYLNHIADLDWLIALEFGRVDDGQPDGCWRGVTDAFGWCDEVPGGPCVGFKVDDFSAFDPNDQDAAAIWEEPRFDAPVLGLSSASAGEIVVAAKALFGRQSTPNRWYFNEAVDASGEEALQHWLACLQCGDSMAHFALGYTLYELGQFHLAYRHLRHDAEIAPNGSWNWRWFGQAAEAIGETDEARRAYERAVEIEEAGGHETDAFELLRALNGEGRERRAS